MAQTYAQPQQKQAQETALAAPQPSAAPAARAGFAPPQCAVAPGAEQGGIVDWFRERFPRRDREEEPAQQWVEDSYGPVDLSQVTDQPAADSILADLVKPYNQEGPAQSPVFETHSFMPRAEVDGTDAFSLHSFIGLRFTQMDPKTGRVQRKRLKVGFGGDGAAVNDHGARLNDTNTQADMSSETPISRAQLETAFSEIPRKVQKPYHVLFHNCNHFTLEMAQLMGATLPAKLHDSVLGPARAYKNLARAAEGGEQDRTRFFQGGGVGRKFEGQMSLSRRAKFLKDFWSTTKLAARRDGLPFLLYPSLSLKAQQVQAAGQPLITAWESNAPLDPDDQPAFAENTRNLIQQAEALAQLRLWKRHPRVTIAAKKIVAAAKLVQEEKLPAVQRTVSQYSPGEINTFLTLQTNEEARLQNEPDTGDRKAKNISLFGFNEVNFEGAGEIFLNDVGISAPDLIQRHRPGGDLSSVQQCDLLLEEVLAALRAPSPQLDEHLLTFLQNRNAMTISQLGALAANGILNHLTVAGKSNSLSYFLMELANAGRSIAMGREENSLDAKASPDAQKQADFYVNQVSTDLSKARRRELLVKMNAMETLLARRCEALRAQMLGQAVPAPEGEE